MSLRLQLSVLPVVLLFLAAPSARADTGPSACFLLMSGPCAFVQTPATCAAQCTPPAFVAACDAQCTDDASATCLGTCTTDCQTKCVDNPAFACAGDCVANCQVSCTTACDGESADCGNDCMLDCSNRCGLECSPVPPSADCNTQCQADCNGFCQTQANIDCQVNCMANVAAGSCNADCMSSQGAVFCGTPPQYVDLSTASSDCVYYLEDEGISPDAGTPAPDAGTPAVKKHQGCAAAPGGDGFGGALEAAALLFGFGLLAARRRA